jgi:hypothetical protein
MINPLPELEAAVKVLPAAASPRLAVLIDIKSVEPL